MDSAASESSTRKEAEEEPGKRSEMAGVRSEVYRKKMDLLRPVLAINENSANKEAAPLLAGMDSAGGESVMRNEAKGKSGKRSEMHYEWMKRPGESEADYEKRLGLLKQQERRNYVNGEARKAEGSGKSAMNQKATSAKVKPEEGMARTTKTLVLHSQDNLPTKNAKAKDGELAKPEDSVTEAGKPQESDQEAREQEARSAKVKKIQESMAMKETALLHILGKLPMKKAMVRLEESGKPKDSATEVEKAEVPLTEAGKPEGYVTEFLKAEAPATMKNTQAKDKESADPSSTNSMIIQDNHLDRGKSALVKKTANEEAEDYARYRRSWESNSCKNCDYFEDSTVLSSMQFTHCTLGIIPCGSAGDTLQIFSMKLKLKLTDVAGGFELPLSLYGVVAARDTVDSGRNILFSCDRTEAQELTQDDPFLHLTGPSRAIVSKDRVQFEIELKVKGAAASQDKSLITCAQGYTGGGPGISTRCFENVFCTLELCLQPVEQTVQATILSVQIVKKIELWPLNFAYGGLIACTPLPRTTMVAADNGVSSNQIVLIESKGRPMPKGDRGYVHLWRQVVSVECGGGLDVVIQAYSKSGDGDVLAEGHVHFTAQNCHVSELECIVGEAKVTIAVAWSLVPHDMDDLCETGISRVLGKSEASVTEVGKAEAPVTDAGKPQESDQEAREQEARMVKVKKIQESMAMKETALLHIVGKLPMKKAMVKDEESGKPKDSATEVEKAEVPLTEAGKPEGYVTEFLKAEVPATMKKNTQAKDKESADPSSTNSMIIQDNHLDRGKSSLVKKTANKEAEDYARYRRSWESNSCKNCDYFEDSTVLSSMLFTHYTPGFIPYSGVGAAVDTLQIFSMKLKLTDVAGGFELPLSLYGVVAARDTVDSGRNILFSCDRTEAQELTQDDPFLHLTGPSRAIVSKDRVQFEIELKVKGAAASQDKSLITCAQGYTGGGPGISTRCFKNVFCTLELCSQPVKRTVQATILSVQIVNKIELSPLNFAYGGLIACTPLPRTTMVAADNGVSSNQIVLIESKGIPMPKGDHGYVFLWRHVVSVERGGGLDVVIQAYSKSSDVHAEGHAHFPAQNSYISQKECTVGEAQVTVSVAWSLVPDDMDDVVLV